MTQRTILVTGASSGFGKAISMLFAEKGYRVIGTARRLDKLNELKDLIQQQGGEFHSFQMDVRNFQEVKLTFEKIQQDFQSVDILVNNAGLAAGLSTIDEGDIDDWNIMIDTNIKGLLYVTKCALPLIPTNTGHIVNIGSTAGKQVYKNGNVYCATKYAVDALNQAMRIDLLEKGIKATAINPGMAETEFSLVRFKGDEEKAKSVYEGVYPLLGQDIASIVWFVTQLPDHVCINDLTVTCKTQANAFYSIKSF